MSAQNLLTRLRASGASVGSPLFAALERVAEIEPQESLQAPPPTFPPILSTDVPQVARLVPISRAQFEEPPAVGSLHLVQTGERVVQSLTRCLDDAPCREIARTIFRVIFELGLEVARYQGHAASVTRSVFHLPAELVMAFVRRQKSAFYDNLGYLRRLGLIDCEAHMGDLRGQSVATGTVWAVSLQPERVLNRQATPVRLVKDDWDRPWRNLNADVREGRTAYKLLHPRMEGVAGESGDAEEAAKGTATPEKNGQDAVVSMADLRAWAITPFLPSPTDTLTVRPAPEKAQNIVWALGDAALKRRHERAAVVDRQARTLAAAFGDGENSLGFWRRLIWNITRGIDAGESLADDVGVVLARVLGDVQHDISSGGTPPRKPAAVVNAALWKAGLLDQLRAWEHRGVGSRPAA